MALGNGWAVLSRHGHGRDLDWPLFRARIVAFCDKAGNLASGRTADRLGASHIT